MHADETKRRSLSGGLLLALLGHLITVMVRKTPTAFYTCLILSLLYVLFLAVRAGVLIQRPANVAHFDLVLCRWSWLFIVGPVTAFLGTAYSMEARNLNPNVLIFGYESGWLTFQIIMEAGLAFSVATACCPQEVVISKPRFLWKALAFPMSLTHAFYVSGSLTRGFGQAL